VSTHLSILRVVVKEMEWLTDSMPVAAAIHDAEFRTHHWIGYMQAGGFNRLGKVDKRFMKEATRRFKEAQRRGRQERAAAAAAAGGTSEEDEESEDEAQFEEEYESEEYESEPESEDELDEEEVLVEDFMVEEEAVLAAMTEEEAALELLEVTPPTEEELVVLQAL